MEIIHAGLRGMFDLLKNVIAIQHRITEVDFGHRDSYPLTAGAGKRLLFVNSLPEPSFVSREIFFSKF